MKIKHKIAIKTMFVVIFIFNIYSTAFFPHRHLMGDIEIVHSHPYKKNCDGKPSHSHTWAQIYTISELTNTSLTPDISNDVSLAIVNPLQTDIEVPVFIVPNFADTKENLTLRSPPYKSSL